MKTQAKTFGTGDRISHDSSNLYKRKIYQTTKTNVRKKSTQDIYNLPRKVNVIYNQSSESMTQLPSNSIDLMVTSPPYNVGKDYEEDLSMDNYRAMLQKVWQEVFRVLKVGGRACINVANIGRKPYIPLSSIINQDMIEIGFLMRGEVIWNKSASAGTSCAWGSWCSSSNPVLRDVHEYILIYSKEEFSKKGIKQNQSTISDEEFLEYTKSIWNFPTESAKRVNHAAPFPVELPSRCIKLYSYKDDIILDPFMGSGTTAISALLNERKYIGYEISKDYVDIAKKRIDKEIGFV